MAAVRLPLVLASASPRRLDLLARLGITPARVISTDIDETPIKADTVVGVGRRILPKGETEAEARHCLALLSGRRHCVTTGVVLALPDGRRIKRLVETNVTFQRLTAAQMEDYIASGEWQGKAGAYGIQGRAEAFTRFISGSHSNVVGLPLFETAQMLRGIGWLKP